MRNLWIFFAKYYAFFLFLTLEIICFILISSNRNFQQVSILNSTNYVVGNLYDQIGGMKSYFKLRDINSDLVNENARLKNELAKYLNVFPSKSLKSIDTALLRQYSFIPGRVINNTIRLRNNYLTLNIGWSNGVRKNMGVVCDQGIVGIVKDVSKHFCTVVSVLHKDTKISAKVKKSDEFGSLTWDGINPRIVQLNDIPTHVVLRENDEIVTTGFSTMFPEGIKIGLIKNIELKSGDNFLNLEVLLSTDFSRIQNVYVLSNQLKDERYYLESRIKND